MRNSVPRTALPGRSWSTQDRLAKGLGFFSIALGILELAAPRALCRAIGATDIPAEARFASASARLQNDVALAEILADTFRQGSVSRWILFGVSLLCQRRQHARQNRPKRPARDLNRETLGDALERCGCAPTQTAE